MSEKHCRDNGTLTRMEDVPINKSSKVKRINSRSDVLVEQYMAQLEKAHTLLEQETTRSKQAEKALRESEDLYHYLIDSIPCAILRTNQQGKITSWNQRAEEIFGHRASEMMGQNILGTIISETNHDFRESLQGITDTAKSSDLSYRHYESWEGAALHANGQQLWMEWTACLVLTQDGVMGEVLLIGIDRTERQQAEELVAQHAADKAIATERSRLARELHDAVSQTLFSTSLIAEVLPILWERDQDEGRRRLQEIRQLTRGALAEMRMLLLELRPSALVNTELDELLTHLCEAVSSRTLIPIMVHVSRCELAVEAKLAFYRIVQEALNNLGKHSGASRAEVTLSCSSSQVELRITDNGRGFDVTSIPESSLGIRIMRERAAAISATFEIRSQPGKGTEVIVSLNDASREVSP
jgi:PAS domain S-box-containing protein